MDPGTEGLVAARPAVDEIDEAPEAATEEATAEAEADPAVAELEALRDRHLRLAAEYDNFRRRTARERDQMWHRAQAEVVSQILDAIDDLGRVSDLDPETTAARDIIEGVEMVERKLVRELESAGLERIGTVGEPFDPNHHEAVGMLPADTDADDQTVGMVLQLGYKFGGALIRPARVQVRIWQGAAGEE